MNDSKPFLGTNGKTDVDHSATAADGARTSEDATAQSSLLDLVTSLQTGLAARNATYLRRRRLSDGPDKTAMAFVEELIETLGAEHSVAVQAAFVTWAAALATDLEAVSLVVAGRLGLKLEYWDAAETLGRELVGRDHHDLLAQRLIDAALEQVHDLETETDRWLKSRICRAPFQEIETRTNGQVHFCCSAWQPVPIGRLETPGPDGFWNSDRAKEIRRSVLDGDFSHCSRWHCPSIAGRRLPAKKEGEARPSLHSKESPARVILSHDRSCNISCPSCRTGLINLPHKETNKLNKVFEERLLPLVNDAKRIKVTGSGDPFGSRHFRHLIGQLTAKEADGRRIQLHTNGLLANRRAWNELNLWNHVSSVWISIDAAEPDTYSVLRRGGKFETLLENLEFLGGLNAAGDIDTLRLDFVVQQANFREMPAFVDLARRIGADGVYFLRLRNWGHVAPSEFRGQDVCSPDHPDHARLLDVLSDDRFVSDAVELGSMTQLVTAARHRQGSQ